MATDLVAIDISHWQPDPIDFNKVKASGIVGCIHKATEGTSYTDPKLFSRASAAMAAGLKWSTYHFLKGGNPAGQMDYYLGTVSPAQGERVCIDHEEKATLAELKQAVQRILDKRPDLQITIYSGHLIKDQLGNGYDELLAKNTSLWLAQYSSTPSWPKGTWPNWSLWQYTDKASVPGVKGAVDGNAFNGSPENCGKWFGPAGEQPAPPPEPPIGQPVVIDITLPDNVPLTLTVNGNTIVDGRF